MHNTTKKLFAVALLGSIVALAACTSEAGGDSEAASEAALNATCTGYNPPSPTEVAACQTAYNNTVSAIETAYAACIIGCGISWGPKKVPTPTPVISFGLAGARAEDPANNVAFANEEAAGEEADTKAEQIPGGLQTRGLGLPTPGSFALCAGLCSAGAAAAAIQASADLTTCLSAANAKTTFCTYPVGDCRNPASACGAGSRCNINSGSCFTPTPTGGGCLPSNPSSCASGFCYPASAGNAGGTCS